MNDDPLQTILNDDHRRFLLDLEFVQTLANPKYLNFLAQRNYLKNPAFINYLDYLRYFKKPEYIKHIRYPQCLYFLDLLQHEQFRQELVQENYCRYIEDQQLYAWQRLQRRRNQLLNNPTGLSGTTVASSTTNSASGTSDVSTTKLR